MKTVERRRMKDIREEIGNEAYIVGKIVKSRMKWAGHNGQNERREITEKILDKETKKL